MMLGFHTATVRRWTAAMMCVALASANGAAPQARAELTVVENADGQQGLTVFKMSVTPAAAPVPAFKHRFVPSALEMRPGNAALYYLRACTEEGVSGRWNAMVKTHGEEEVYGGNYEAGWHSPARPLSDMPLDKVREVAASFDALVEQCIARATVREDCDWGRNIEELEGLDVIGLLLPEVQSMRGMSRMLMLRTRVAIADGDYDRAIAHLRMNYRLGQNVASDPILVCGLVGIACANMGNFALPELIAAKNSPNLYWALAELPRPFIDLYPATRFELSWGTKIFPVLLEPEKQEHSPEEWARLLAKSLRDMQMASSTGGAVYHDWVMRAGVAGFGLLAYPDAKRRLAASGMDAGEIDRMPVGQVIAIDAAREYRRIAEELEKWWYAPYRVARKRIAEPDELIGNKLEGGYGRILAALMMPALSKVRDAQVRLDWHLNGLQTIEAIRMHAAETGKLPQSLAEIKVVPVPKNPVTDADYQYRVDGDAAVLELPFNDGFPGVAWRFEIKLAK